MNTAMKRARTVVLAVAAGAAALAASAQPSPEGGYLVAALGSTSYEYDCWWFADCENARATAAKIGGGWRFGVFAVEGWWIDYGSASIYPQQQNARLHLRSLGLNAAWYLRLGSSVEGVLRAGAAQVSHERSGDGEQRSIDATFGLGLNVALTPTAAVELAWDVTGAEGNNTGSTLASMVTVGLRLRF